ncbi:MAG: acetyl-CoA carboxylase biotin carboxylase subunit [Longimicrobiales bacterium]
MLKSVLVANRGEIALRVLRAARDLGIHAVAVYSEADRESPHVWEADEAHLIGPAPAAESYLVQEKLIRVARDRGIEAIHPGYGFLAERADFAQAVDDAGLIFVGPSADTIRAMGDKTEARRRMMEAGVPVVPGTEAIETVSEAETEAARIGFPVILKASAGGGGKGMRVVQNVGEVGRALEAAKREALAAFGDDKVYLERYLQRPRHIEVQLFGDQQGNVVHLGERECSIQRRHQKLVEEAPSPVLTPDERQRMGEAAVRAAQAVNYVGAGTVEFLYEDGEFFFLEMNTRLQVEHPVTEYVTGLDLVELQFRIASGESLPFEQDDVALTGHAIECRITSESPFDGFLPSTGKVTELSVPTGPNVRWDGGVARGSVIGLSYDPLLGKLIAFGSDRTAAIRRMERALGELTLAGVATCAPLLKRIMAEPDFNEGDLSIRYLEDHPDLLVPLTLEGDPSFPEEVALIDQVAVAAVLMEVEATRRSAPTRLAPVSHARTEWQRGLAP